MESREFYEGTLIITLGIKYVASYTPRYLNLKDL